MTDDAGAIRLVLVDDHVIVRQGLRSILEREPGMAVVGEVGEAANPADALTVVAEQQAEHRQDLILLDLKLSARPTSRGWSCAGTSPPASRRRGIRAHDAAHQPTGRRRAAVRRQGVRAQGRRRDRAGPPHPGGPAQRERVRQPQYDLVVRSLPGDADGPAIHLTDREPDVMRRLAQGLSNRQIDQRLYISETTVKFHVHNIMGKLQVRSRAELVYRTGKLGLV